MLVLHVLLTPFPVSLFRMYVTWILTAYDYVKHDWFIFFFRSKSENLWENT